MARGEAAARPTFEIEEIELAGSGGPIAGIDEAGRGPLAGPVVAAAVILDPSKIPDGINDSKQLQAEEREDLYARIVASAITWAVGIGTVRRIDEINILQASLWAMARAVQQLNPRPCLALIDGNRLPRMRCKARAVIGGDGKSLSIAAASIIAKVTRDRLMIKLGAAHPGYGFEQHKGYSTPEHFAAIERLGVTKHHRRSFRPVQVALGLIEPEPVNLTPASIL
jgi:ribonuclease HII